MQTGPFVMKLMPVLEFLEESITSIGVFLCRGVIPAVSGQFISHGLRTFAYEGTFQGLAALTGGAAELQVC
jgi:hypothetical protein